jgi:adenylate cyclase
MLHVYVSNKDEQKQLEHSGGPIEFGRGPQRDGVPRCIIQDVFVSRDHLRVQEDAEGQIEIWNLSGLNPIVLSDDTLILPGRSRKCELPVRAKIGESWISIEAAGYDPISRDALSTIALPVRARSLFGASRNILELGQSPNPVTLTEWFETVIAVQRAAAGSQEFYLQTARAMVSLVSLDRGLVLLRRGQVWEPVAREPNDASQGREVSQTILRYVVQERRTFYQSSTSLLTMSESLAGVEAVVASPIFDPHDEVVGALYGSRRLSYSNLSGAGIGPLEAQLVQLLASAVGAGLARLEQESEATRLRVQFEQFFSPGLARELQTNPRLLEGQERDVTVMFADIRDFSRLTQECGPGKTFQLVSELMEHIVCRVRQFDGVVVDYMGDGLLSMWNAPTDQPGHAILACRTAIAILNELSAISEKWRDVIGRPLALGIGVNTGLALVGNVGTKHKFKYGPLGHTVNLASRVEGATKYLGVPALITSATRLLLDKSLCTRWLGQFRVAGVGGAVDLYELCIEEVTPEWCSRRDAYEAAVALFAERHWAEAAQALRPLVSDQKDHFDVPSLNLLRRAVECHRSSPDTFDPVVDLPGK